MNATSPIENRARRDVALWLALWVGLALRLGGLSHDLHEGAIYHPDTPKQMRAVERYLDGKYYTHTGLSDYDGYPLFHAHLIEYASRVWAAVAEPVWEWMGFPPRDLTPRIETTYWLARLLSVVLATLAILVAYRIGRESTSRRVGLVAAWMLALSPVDVASAHYESGDTTAAFFALLAVLFAVRIYQRGRRRDYVFGALAGMCAFASKYHAGMALIPVGLAHLLRQRSWRDCVSPASLRAILLLALTCIVGLFLAIPSMFLKPATVLQEIWAFLHHVSSGERLPDAFREASFAGRFVFSMKRHLPILAEVMSWPVCASAVAGLLLVAKGERRMIVLYAMPAVYFLVGVTLRPLAHPVYHTLMTALLFVVAPVVLMQLPRLLAFPLALLALAQLGLGSAREVFFFQQRDTRLIARHWTHENVPLSFRAEPAVYAFDLDRFGFGVGPSGGLHVASSIRSRPAPPDFFPLHTVHLEDHSIPFFRNPTMTLSVGRSDAIRPGFQMPLVNRIGVTNGNRFAFADAPVFWRSERTVVVSDRRPADRWIVSSEPIESAFVVLHNGPWPNLVRAEYGGREQEIRLLPDERRLVEFRNARPSRWGRPGRLFYRWQVSATWGPVRADLALDAREAAVLAFQRGLYAESSRLLLSHPPREKANPAESAVTLLASDYSRTAIPARSRERLESSASALLGVAGDADVMNLFGVSPAYLRALPWESWPVSSLPRSGFVTQRDCAPNRGLEWVARADTNSTWWLAAPRLSLDPAVYQLTLRARYEAGVTGVVSVISSTGRRVWTADFRLPGSSEGAIRRIHIRVPIPDSLVAGHVELSGSGPIEVHSVDCRPDVIETLRALALSLHVQRGEPVEPGAMLFDALAAAGSRWGGEQRYDKALAAIQAAHLLRTNALTPLRVLASLPLPAASDAQRIEGEHAAAREWKPCSVRYRGGAELAGFQIRSDQVKPGDVFGIRLRWRIEKPGRRWEPLVVWIHFEDASGRTIFQGDHALTLSLSRMTDADELMPSFVDIPVPPDVPLGEYRISMGLYDPGQNKRVRVVSSDLTRRGKAVELPVRLVVRP